MSKKISNLLKDAKKLDRSMARQLRKVALEGIIKEAATTNEQHGILQNMQRGVTNYPTRQEFAHQRGGSKPEEKNYGIGPAHQKSQVGYDEAPRTLSTRYSPDRVGVQSYLKDGVQVDPITGKEYDWNEGFTTETGEKFPGGSIDLQSDIYFEY
nr:hypothetical protein 40 [bacterium]